MKKMAIATLAGVLMLFAFSVNGEAQTINLRDMGDYVEMEIIPDSPRDVIGFCVFDGEYNEYSIWKGWLPRETKNFISGTRRKFNIPIPQSGCIFVEAFTDSYQGAYLGVMNKLISIQKEDNYYNTTDTKAEKAVKKITLNGDKKGRRDQTAAYFRSSVSVFASICLTGFPGNCVLLDIEELSSTATTRTKRYTFNRGIGVNGQLPFDLTPSDNGWGDIEMDGNTMTVTFNKGEVFRWSCFYITCKECYRFYVDPIATCKDYWPDNVVQWIDGEQCSNQFIDYY